MKTTKNLEIKIQELKKELEKERQIKKDILKAWREDTEKWNEWSKRK